MHLAQLQRAIKTIESADGDGYHCRVFLAGGCFIDGAIYDPDSNYTMRIDCTNGGDEITPCVVEVEAIIAIGRLP